MSSKKSPSTRWEPGIKAAKPDIAIPLYEAFVSQMEILVRKPVETGEFGADMKVSLVNDGPVTLMLETP